MAETVLEKYVVITYEDMQMETWLLVIRGAYHVVLFRTTAILYKHERLSNVTES